MKRSTHYVKSQLRADRKEQKLLEREARNWNSVERSRIDDYDETDLEIPTQQTQIPL